MSETTGVTARDIDRALTDKDLRGMRIMHFALVGGLTMFLLVAVVLYLTTENVVSKTLDGNELLMMSGAHAFVALTCFALSFILPALMLKPSTIEKMMQQRAANGVPALEPAALYVSAIRGAWVLRLTLQEGPAVFGLIICVMAVNSGAMAEQPLYSLNGLTTMLFLAGAIMAIPSRERALNMFAAQRSR
jgi:hypothetical protein